MKLWLIRHAKSSWGEAGVTDFDRPLNGRGKRDGPHMAAWFAKQSDPATWIWSSSARRALATTCFVQSGFGVEDGALTELDELYLADSETLLDVIRRTPSEIRSAAVVAHNPGLTHLVNVLGQKPVTDNLPTFGIARFDCAGDWHSLSSGACTMELLAAPKTIA